MRIEGADVEDYHAKIVSASDGFDICDLGTKSGKIRKKKFCFRMNELTHIFFKYNYNSKGHGKGAKIKSR